MPKVAFDLDDVILDTVSSFCAFHNKYYGSRVSMEDVSSYDWSLAFGCTAQEIGSRLARFCRSREHGEICPIKGAVEALSALYKGEAIPIITSRNCNIALQTVSVLGKHLPLMVDGVYFTNQSGTPSNQWRLTKGSLCQSLGVEVFVEDAPKYCEEVAPYVKQVILFDAPWNWDYKPTSQNVTRVMSWEEILDIVK